MGSIDKKCLKKRTYLYLTGSWQFKGTSPKRQGNFNGCSKERRRFEESFRKFRRTCPNFQGNFPQSSIDCLRNFKWISLDIQEHFSESSGNVLQKFRGISSQVERNTVTDHGNVPESLWELSWKFCRSFLKVQRTFFGSFVGFCFSAKYCLRALPRPNFWLRYWRFHNVLRIFHKWFETFRKFCEQFKNFTKTVPFNVISQNFSEL